MKKDGTKTRSCPHSTRFTFLNSFACLASKSRDVSPVRVRPHKSACDSVPSVPFPPSLQPTTAARAHTRTRDQMGLHRLSKIFTVVNFDMSTTVRPPSPRSGKLEGEVVAGKRVCSEDSAIKGGAASEPSVLTIVSVLLTLCRLSVSV